MTTLNNTSQTNIEKFGLDLQTLETVEPQHVDPIDPVLQKQLLRKIDWHLLVRHPFRSVVLRVLKRS
jgi:hypothetical protein